MFRSRAFRIVCRLLPGIVLIVTSAVSCRAGASGAPRIVQPGAPGEASRVLAAEKTLELPQPSHTQADVRFMQGMIGHHAQALEMTGLLRPRSRREDMRLLALRIEVSQADEIKLMEQWLEARGEELPDPHAHHGAGSTLMPGMLTPEEMGRLAEATGAGFDRLFLEFMIKHHEGALTMVEDLFATAEAGQEAEIFAFASDVEADQRIEILRMAAMLKEVQQ